MTTFMNWISSGSWGGNQPSVGTHRQIFEEMETVFRVKRTRAKAEKKYDFFAITADLAPIVAALDQVHDIETRKQLLIELYDVMASNRQFVLASPALASTLRKKLTEFHYSGHLDMSWHFRRIFHEELELPGTTEYFWKCLAHQAEQQLCSSGI